MPCSLLLLFPWGFLWRRHLAGKGSYRVALLGDWRSGWIFTLRSLIFSLWADPASVNIVLKRCAVLIGPKIPRFGNRNKPVSLWVISRWKLFASFPLIFKAFVLSHLKIKTQEPLQCKYRQIYLSHGFWCQDSWGPKNELRNDFPPKAWA